MSTPVVPNEGENDLLNLIKAGTFSLRLFRNNHTPAAASVLADFTEANYSGYSAQTLSYGTPATNGSGQGQMTATIINFDHNGGATSNTIYGYYLVNTGTSKVVKAEKLDSTVSMAFLGDRIAITEKMLCAGTIT
jgi:hypothetical protein